MIRYLSLDDLLRIADASVAGEVVVRDAGLLESAPARPQASVFGADARSTLDLKAAALLRLLAPNHSLVDGDERLAWAAIAVFFGVNGHRVVPGQDEVVDLVLAVATGSLDDLEKIAARLASWSPGR